MNEKRNIGMVAALAGLLVAVAAIVSVPSAAMADELSDLRANSELLQRRLDQIENATPDSASGGSAKPAIPETAGGSFPRSFLLPGSDTSVRVGGNVTETFSYVRPR